MAWIKSKTKKAAKEITLSVNTTNFPGLSSYYSGECVAPTKGDNWVNCHTGGNGSITVNLGTFNTKGYTKLIFNCSSNNWGGSVPSDRLYCNGIAQQYINKQGSTSVTVNIGKRDTSSAYLQCSFVPNDNAWVRVQINSVTFVP